jgi:hypothetical protein
MTKAAIAIQVQDASDLRTLAHEFAKVVNAADAEMRSIQAIWADPGVRLFEPPVSQGGDVHARVARLPRARRTKRPMLLTPTVLAQVPGWVDAGKKPDEIAALVGCTVGTLRVRCSQNGISLRRVKPEPPPKQPKPPKKHPRLVLALPPSIIAALETRADGHGVSSSQLAASLIKTIVADNLFAAVLDGEPT